MEKKNRESIDILDILAACLVYIKKFIAKSIAFLGWTLKFIYAHKMIVGCFVALSFVIAYFLSDRKNRIYKASADVFINIESSYFFNNSIEIIDAYCKNTNKSFLANSFGISTAEAKNFMGINSYYVIDEQMDRTPDWIDFERKYKGDDTTSMIMPSRLHIELYLKDTTLLKKFPEYFHYYLQKNPEINHKNELRLQQMDIQIESMKYEIAMLDSLRKLEYFKRNREIQPNQDKMVIFNEKDKRLYHGDMLDLQRRLNELEWNQKINRDFVDFGPGFTLDPKAVNGRIKTFLICGLIGVVVGFLVALLISSRKRIFNYLKN